MVNKENIVMGKNSQKLRGVSQNSKNSENSRNLKPNSGNQNLAPR